MAQNAEATLTVKIKESGKQALGDIASGLDEIKVKAGIASAAITGFIALSVKEYANSERAAESLRASLINQGLDVDKLSKKYSQLAKELQEKTVYDDDAIVSGIALAQGMMGQLELTDDLIKATVDFASATGKDLQTAFMLVGKSIGTNTNALMRDGIQVDENATKSEKLAQVLRGLQGRAHGAAEAAGKTLGGSLSILKNQLGEILETIGKQFAPFVLRITEYFTKFAKVLQDDTFAKYAAIVLGISGALTGLIAVLGTLVGIMPSVVAGLGLIRIGISALWGPIGIIVGAITALVVGFEVGFDNILQILKNFANASGGILKSLFTVDIKGFSKSVKDMGNIFKDGLDDQLKKSKEKTQKEIDEEKRSADAKERIRKEKAKEAEDLDKQRFQEMQDWKKQKEEEALNERIRIKKALEEAEMQRAKQLSGYIEATISGGIQRLSSEFVKTYTETILPGFGAAAGALFDLFSMENEQFKERMLKIFDSKFFSNIIENFFTVFADPKFQAQLVYAFANGFTQGIKNAGGSIVGSILEMFRIVFQKAFSGSGFINGIAEGTFKGLSEAIRRVSDQFTRMVVNAFIDAYNAITEGGGNIVTGIAKKINEAAGLGMIGEDNDLKTQIGLDYFRRVKLNEDEIEELNKGLDAIKNSELYKYYGNQILSVYEKQFKEEALSKPISSYISKLVSDRENYREEAARIAEIAASEYEARAYEARRYEAARVAGLYHGGMIPAYASGGLIDNQIIRASAGEFVTNKDSTSANLGLLNAINSSNGRSVGSGTTVIINVNGGMLGDRQSAEQFARAIDEELYRLRIGNASRAFDRSLT